MNSCGKQEREGFGAQEKSATVFFYDQLPHQWCCSVGHQQHHQTHHSSSAARLRLRRRYPGTEEMQENKLVATTGKSLARQTSK